MNTPQLPRTRVTTDENGFITIHTETYIGSGAWLEVGSLTIGLDAAEALIDQLEREVVAFK